MLDTGFDSDDSDSVSYADCPHLVRTTLCGHCQKRYCNQCELLHKYSIKKEIEHMLTSCEEKLSSVKIVDHAMLLANAKLTLEKALQELHDDVNKRVAISLQSIASTNRRERHRVITEAKKLAEDRARRFIQVLSESQSLNVDKMKGPDIAKYVSRLEKLLVMMDDLHFGNDFVFHENPSFDDAVKKFLGTKPVFLLEKPDSDFSSFPSSSVSTPDRVPPSIVVEDRSSRAQNGASGAYEAKMYGKMSVVAEVSGDDKFGDVIKAPLGVALVIVRGERVFAVVHGCRISLFSLRGNLIETLKIRCSEVRSDMILSGDVAADATGSSLFLGARAGRSSCVYKIELGNVRKKNESSVSTNSVSPDVFVQLRGRLYGLAVSSARSELFTAMEEEIQSFSLKTGELCFTYRIYPSNTGHLVSKVQCVVDGNGESLLLFTKEAGKELVQLNLSKKVEKRLLPKVVTQTAPDIRGATVDPVGRVLVLHRHSGINVMDTSKDQVVGELAPGQPEKKFDLRGVAAYWPEDGSQSPVVAVTDNHANQVIFFSANAV